LVKLMSDVGTITGAADRRRWLILGVIALAPLMVVLDRNSGQLTPERRQIVQVRG
jgi:Na+-transporting NADH:ubiquinone oxidoreductase subunit NqrB